MIELTMIIIATTIFTYLYIYALFRKVRKVSKESEAQDEDVEELKNMYINDEISLIKYEKKLDRKLGDEKESKEYNVFDIDVNNRDKIESVHQLANDRIISSSADDTVKIWNKDD
jgi:cbb3-type cytochrome oxidase subunit 3